MLRRSAVAGRFYPGETDHLLSVLGGFAQQRGQRIRAVGLVVPHAGYMYSGHVAGEVYSRVEVPARCIMMCPNHTGLGSPVAIMQSGEWETPLGRVPIDEAMATELLSLDPDLKVDASAHRLEHALEVQLPFPSVSSRRLSIRSDRSWNSRPSTPPGVGSSHSQSGGSDRPVRL